MVYRTSAANEAALATSEAYTTYQVAMQDGVISEEEDREIRAGLECVICRLELLALATNCVFQLLRTPESAPNRHIKAQLKEVSALIQDYQQGAISIQRGGESKH